MNRGRTEEEPDNVTVQKVATVVAWECLRRTYRPGPALREDILRSLKDTDNAEEHVKYLEKPLSVIRIAGISEDSVLFELDPLAEYLAGLHLVELYRDNEEHWLEFLSQADDQKGAPESIRGFFLAVRDCCLARNIDAEKKTDWRIPDFVIEELDDRAGLDPEVLRQIRIQQRVQRLISSLSVPEVDDRDAAAQALAQIGPDAKAAVPALIQALKDEGPHGRGYVTAALGGIGPDAKAAVPALTEALKDENLHVREYAAKALGNIGPDAKAAVPGLIEALKDAFVNASESAALALGKIGPDAKAAVPALTLALSDDFIHNKAEEALKQIKPESDDQV